MSKQKTEDSVFDKAVNIDWEALWKLVPHDYGQTGENVRFICDDAGGVLRMIVGPDGDVHLGVDEYPNARECGHIGPPNIRIRTFQGGGHSHRVRKAALLLMLAIIEDEREGNARVSLPGDNLMGEILQIEGM